MCLQLPKSILHLQSRGENTDRSMAQFSSNWRVPGCLVEQEESILPDFHPAAEMLWADSHPGANSHLHQAPSFPLCSVIGSKTLVPRPCFLYPRTSMPIWFAVPRRKQVEISLICGQRRQGTTWPRSSNIKAKLRSGV